MYLAWTIWGGLFILTFAVLEGYALVSKEMMLTDYVRAVTADHPILEPAIIGVLVFLVVHFWWQTKAAS